MRNEEFLNQGLERRMTAKTLAFLRSKQAQLQRCLQALGQMSEPGHQRAELHDDPALANEKNSVRSQLERIGSLNNVIIIEPRQDTDIIGLGNQVKVLYADGRDVSLTLLGTDDVLFKTEGFVSNPTIISYQSPLGSVLVGRSKGETVVYSLPNGRKVIVIITDVCPGNF